MLRRCAEYIVDWQIGRNNLKDEERALYKYAYEILLNQLLNIIISAVIAIVLHTPLPVFVFLISYIPLRSYCGGYHSNTNWGCTLVSGLLVCFVSWIAKYGQLIQNLAFPLFVFVFSGFIIFLFAPVPDINKPLDFQEIKRYRTISRLIWGLEAIIGFLCFNMMPVGFIVMLSHIILCIMLFLGMIKNCNKSRIN